MYPEKSIQLATVLCQVNPLTNSQCSYCYVQNQWNNQVLLKLEEIAQKFAKEVAGFDNHFEEIDKSYIEDVIKVIEQRKILIILFKYVFHLIYNRVFLESPSYKRNSTIYSLKQETNDISNHPEKRTSSVKFNS